MNVYGDISPQVAFPEFAGQKNAPVVKSLEKLASFTRNGIQSHRLSHPIPSISLPPEPMPTLPSAGHKPKT